MCHTDRNNYFWNMPSQEGRINKCSPGPDRCPHSWRPQAACLKDRFAAQPGYQANSRSQFTGRSMFPFHFKSEWPSAIYRLCMWTFDVCVCVCVMLGMFEDHCFNMQIRTEICCITSKLVSFTPLNVLLQIWSTCHASQLWNPPT